MLVIRGCTSHPTKNTNHKISSSPSAVFRGGQGSSFRAFQCYQWPWCGGEGNLMVDQTQRKMKEVATTWDLKKVMFLLSIYLVLWSVHLSLFFGGVWTCYSVSWCDFVVTHLLLPCDPWPLYLGSAIYVYTRTQMTLVLIGKGLVLGRLTFKNRVEVIGASIFYCFPCGLKVPEDNIKHLWILPVESYTPEI